MPHSIICGVDGSEASRSAARVGARLAATLNVNLALAHATQDRPSFPYHDDPLGELQRPDAIEEGQRLLESVAAELAGAAPELRVTFGTPVEALRALCDEESAELLIVGSRERGHLAAAALGSVSARLVGSAHCPVVVVSAPGATDRFLARETTGGSMVCGVDASRESGTRDETEEVPMRTPTRDNRAVDHTLPGRFSEGSEQFPNSPDKLRRGRFSTGIEQLPDTPTASEHHTGRFSEGIATLPRTPARLHRGSFADRDDTTWSRPRTRRG